MTDAGAGAVADEIWALLPDSSGQLGAVATCLHRGIEDRAAIVDEGAAANSGAVGNVLAAIRAIRWGEVPDAPSIARLALGSTRSFRRQHLDSLSPAAVAHLDSIIVRLDAAASNAVAQEAEETQIQANAGLLEAELAGGGVYVYTYPHYFRHPTVEGTQRTALKVGMTTVDADGRVFQQAQAAARSTGLPEDPLILRVYRSDSDSPRRMEQAFHRLLRAADHTRETTRAGGTEWFETSLTFLDAIAHALAYNIVQGDQPA